MNIILTCRVGENIINCFDGKYDKYILKKWSDKNILICKDCGNPYEYCHGRIVLPYFRHKEKDINCGSKYFETETQEHILGKQILYNRLLEIQNIGIIKNLKLEAYISETKQRPDIYFEKDNQKFIIEFQCTPISTQYLERSELYKLANINDIWVMGLKKYNIVLDVKRQEVYKIGKGKILEYYSHYYLDINNKELCCSGSMVKHLLPYGYSARKHYIYPVDNFIIRENELSIDDNVLNNLKLLDIKYFEKNKNRIILKEKKEQMKSESECIGHNKINMIAEIKNRCSDIINIEFLYSKNNSDYYLWRLDIKYNLNNFIFFIKYKSIDFCKFYPPKKYVRIEKHELNIISEEQIINYIVGVIHQKLNNYHSEEVL